MVTSGSRSRDGRYAFVAGKRVRGAVGDINGREMAKNA
jgi:hypothetical protein